MERLEKQISYLQGLADGYDVREASKEGKIIAETIDILEELYASQRHILMRLEALEEYVESIDEDLNDLEIFTFGEDDLSDEDEVVDIYYDLDDSESTYTDQAEQMTPQ